jgi:hypothetical protein
VQAEEAVKRHLRAVCEAHVEFVETIFENA